VERLLLMEGLRLQLMEVVLLMEGVPPQLMAGERQERQGIMQEEVGAVRWVPMPVGKTEGAGNTMVVMLVMVAAMAMVVALLEAMVVAVKEAAMLVATQEVAQEAMMAVAEEAGKQAMGAVAEEVAPVAKEEATKEAMTAAAEEGVKEDTMEEGGVVTIPMAGVETFQMAEVYLSAVTRVAHLPQQNP